MIMVLDFLEGSYVSPPQVWINQCAADETSLGKVKLSGISLTKTR